LHCGPGSPQALPRPVDIPQFRLPRAHRLRASVDPHLLGDSRHLERIARPQHEVRGVARGDASELRAEAEDLRRIGGQRSQCGIPRQAMRDGDAGRLAHLARVVRAVAEVREGDAHAGLVQARRVLERGTELVEGAGQVHQRVEDDGDTGLGELRRHLPRLRTADQHWPRAELAGEAEHLANVAGAIHVEGNAAAAEVACQHLAPGGRQQPEVGVAHLRRRFRLVRRLLEEHQLRGAAHAGAEVGEQRATRRQGRLHATVETCHRALARDDRCAGNATGSHHREGDAFDAVHADHGRVGIKGTHDVELGPRLGRCGAAVRAARRSVVHGARLELDLHHAECGDATEQSGRQWPALRLDHGCAGSSEAGADRCDAAVAHQYVGSLERAALGDGMHRGVSDQQVLRRRRRRGEQQRAEQNDPSHGHGAHFAPPTGWPRRKSESG